MSQKEQLKTQFLNILEKYKVSPIQSNLVFDNLYLSYIEPYRQYHTISHIVHILSILNIFSREIEDYDSLFLATWYHDSIYIPHSKENEEHSAQRAVQELSILSLDIKIIQKVEQLVLCTKKHELLINSNDAMLFLDADISILGSTREEYIQYMRNIRNEYSIIEENKYKIERLKVLKHFLDKTPKYYHSRMNERLEAQSIYNLTYEIEMIQNTL